MGGLFSSDPVTPQKEKTPAPANPPASTTATAPGAPPPTEEKKAPPPPTPPQTKQPPPIKQVVISVDERHYTYPPHKDIWQFYKTYDNKRDAYVQMMAEVYLPMSQPQVIRKPVRLLKQLCEKKGLPTTQPPIQFFQQPPNERHARQEGKGTTHTILLPVSVLKTVAQNAPTEKTNMKKQNPLQPETMSTKKQAVPRAAHPRKNLEFETVVPTKTVDHARHETYSTFPSEFEADGLDELTEPYSSPPAASKYVDDDDTSLLTAAETKSSAMTRKTTERQKHTKQLADERARVQERLNVLNKISQPTVWSVMEKQKWQKVLDSQYDTLKRSENQLREDVEKLVNEIRERTQWLTVIDKRRVALNIPDGFIGEQTAKLNQLKRELSALRVLVAQRESRAVEPTEHTSEDV